MHEKDSLTNLLKVLSSPTTRKIVNKPPSSFSSAIKVVPPPPHRPGPAAAVGGGLCPVPRGPTHRQPPELRAAAAAPSAAPPAARPASARPAPPPPGTRPRRSAPAPHPAAGAGANRKGSGLLFLGSPHHAFVVSPMRRFGSSETQAEMRLASETFEQPRAVEV